MISCIAAVHVITESSDHYNYLIGFVSTEHFITQIKDKLGDELAHVSQLFVTTNIKEDDQVLKRLICDAVDEAYEIYQDIEPFEGL